MQPLNIRNNSLFFTALIFTSFLFYIYYKKTNDELVPHLHKGIFFALWQNSVFCIYLLIPRIDKVYSIVTFQKKNINENLPGRMAAFLVLAIIDCCCLASILAR